MTSPNLNPTRVSNTAQSLHEIGSVGSVGTNGNNLPSLPSPRRRFNAHVSFLRDNVARNDIDNNDHDHGRLNESVSPLTTGTFSPTRCNEPPSSSNPDIAVSRSTSLAWNRDFSFEPRTVTYKDEDVRTRPIMAYHDDSVEEEKDGLLSNHHGESSGTTGSRDSEEDDHSVTSISTTSLVLENLNRNSAPVVPGKPSEPLEYRDDDSDLEAPQWKDVDQATRGVGGRMSRQLKIIIWVISIVGVVGWSMAFVSFLVNGKYLHSSKRPFDHESPIKSSGRKVTMEQVQTGVFSPNYASLNWIHGANGEDGLLLEVGRSDKDFLVVEDIRSRQDHKDAHPSKTLLKSGWQRVGSKQVWAQGYWPSPDLTKVLVVTRRESVYRHSFTGVYYIVDVQTQTAEPLDPEHPEAKVQLAQWAPSGDSIVFTRDNNMFLRVLSSTAVRQITQDGGSEYFYGIPDWVYEEEVFQSNIATWWAPDGQYCAFMRTNETLVPEYPVQFFMTRPNTVFSGLENYPETEKIKYPKAGAPNPFVEMLFYDVARNEVFQTTVGGGFADDDRLIADVLWTEDGHCLVREVNRVSDHIRMVLVDVAQRTGKVVRTEDRKALDGGWVEPGQTAVYVPADPTKGRPEHGYVDVVIDGDNHHLAYFTPMDNPSPLMLTTGAWDIDQGQAYSVDLDNNVLYFVAAKEDPTSRHVYSVDFEGKEIKPIVPIDKLAYFEASFSVKGGYAIIKNAGPGIPTQEVISTPSNPVKYSELLANNTDLSLLATSHELEHKVWSTVTVDGYTLQVLERRPPHFDPNKKYPVLFYQYSGPGSQTVNRKFGVDFQSYVASSLDYIVVTVDGRGTGFSGRKLMCTTRGSIGTYEAHDQIATAKIWAAKSYVDPDRLAIWGWSFGGFTTLKTLELDAGRTFRYGMAVAPVTDWRFYDSVYTERYMFKPQDNQKGYETSAVTNVTALSQNVRFLIMHGTGDDNVHVQNSLTLIDKLDLQGVTNYDVHFFPDSNHNIAFHGANRVVYEKLEKWLVSAFNGVWYKYEDPTPEW